MDWYKTMLSVQTNRKGLHDFTGMVNEQIIKWGVKEGMAFLFVEHTSASLVINENYASSARRDMEGFLEHLAPEGESWYEHTLEGSDDTPAHMRAMITPVSMTIPIDNGMLSLGTWQGLYLAEHRRHGHLRRVLLRVLAVE